MKKQSPRLLCVQLPMWPIDRLRRRLEPGRQADVPPTAVLKGGAGVPARLHSQADGTVRAGGGRDARPTFPSGQTESVALLLVSTRGNVQHIAACCRAAQRAGVRIGMTLAQARAMVGGEIHVEDFNPAHERAAMKRLAEWLSLRFSPIVSVDPCTLNDRISADDPLPDGLVMDITGCERLFGGEERLAHALFRSLARFGFEVRIGIGPTIGAAWAAARWGGLSSLPCDEVLKQPGKVAPPITILSSDVHALRMQLEPLPVRALRIEAQTVQALVELGIETIGQVLALPRPALPSRFGPLLVRRIDQALGTAIETVEPVRPRPPLRAQRLFDGPTPQIEAIEAATRELLVELCRELLTRESGVRVLEAIFERIGRNGRGTELLTERITLSRPSRNARHLWSLLRQRVEKLHMGYGIESIALAAMRIGRLRHRQSDYVENRHQGIGAPRHEAGGHEAAGQLIDTLLNRLGPDRVLRAELVESHVPERASRLVPAADAGSKRTARSVSSPARSAPLRPTLLLDRPEPAEVIAMAPDRPPTTLRWRGRQRRIVAAVGPERIAGEWWRVTVPTLPALRQSRCFHPQNTDRSKQRSVAQESQDAWERDYFRVCDDEGQWLWIYRQTPLFRPQDLPDKPIPVRWFVHGVWT